MNDTINKLIITTFILIFSTQAAALAVPNNFDISVGNSNIQFQLIDPIGNITGYDVNTHTKSENIPNTVYRTVLPYEGDSQIPVGHSIEQKEYALTSTVAIGKYTLIFSNTSNIIEHYSIQLSIVYYQDKKLINSYIPDKTIYPNTTWKYEFDISNIPQGNIAKTAAGISKYNTLPLIKVSTPADFIKDLTTAGQLGYIGNPKFVSELTKEINEIEKNKIIYEKDDTAIPPNQITKKKYQELLTKIAERYNKPEANEFVKAEAYTVLKEDLEYIIGHL